MAKYSYFKHEEDEISFKKGQKFLLKERHEKSGWFVVETFDKKTEGLAPGNYFKIIKVERKKEKEEKKEEVQPVEEDEDSPPPLPGPPPAWSDTIAGKAAIEIAKQLKKGGDKPPTSKSPRSPRPAMDIFAEQKTESKSPREKKTESKSPRGRRSAREEYMEGNKNEGASVFGVALKKTEKK